eukprot:scaffold31521_cov55-Attheya_sp.AAC.4
MSVRSGVPSLKTRNAVEDCRGGNGGGGGGGAYKDKRDDDDNDEVKDCYYNSQEYTRLKPNQKFALKKLRKRREENGGKKPDSGFVVRTLSRDKV